MRALSVAILVGLLQVSCSNEKDIRVGLQPLGDFDTKLIDTVSAILERNYAVKTVILNKIDIPQETFVTIKTPRYRADRLIKYLKENKSDTIDYVIGLLRKDISFTKKDKFGNVKEPEDRYKDWGIFGLGYRPGPSCVVSTYRIGSKNESVFIERIKKISVHELGHNLGLDHCTTVDCVMQDAVETIKTIDNVKAELCNSCKRKLM